MELVVGLVIGGIIILTIGVISSVSIGSVERLRTETDVYNDLAWAFNMMARAARNSVTCSADNAEGQKALTFGDKTFQVKNGAFVYTVSEADHPIIQGADSISFDFGCDKDAGGNWQDCSSTSKLFHITLLVQKTFPGKQHPDTFDQYLDVMRRNY
jgi:hypothetical protein